MVMSDIVWFKPSKVPVNRVVEFPTGEKPAPMFHVDVAVASMLLLKAYVPARLEFIACNWVTSFTSIQALSVPVTYDV